MGDSQLSSLVIGVPQEVLSSETVRVSSSLPSQPCSRLIFHEL